MTGLILWFSCLMRYIQDFSYKSDYADQIYRASRALFFMYLFSTLLLNKRFRRAELTMRPEIEGNGQEIDKTRPCMSYYKSESVSKKDKLQIYR